MRNHEGGPFLPAKLAPFFAATDKVVRGFFEESADRLIAISWADIWYDHRGTRVRIPTRAVESAKSCISPLAVLGLKSYTEPPGSRYRRSTCAVSTPRYHPRGSIGLDPGAIHQ